MIAIIHDHDVRIDSLINSRKHKGNSDPVNYQVRIFYADQQVEDRGYFGIRR